MTMTLQARPEITLENSLTFTFASCKERVTDEEIVRTVSFARGGEWFLINEDVFPALNPKSGNYVWMLRRRE